MLHGVAGLKLGLEGNIKTSVARDEEGIQQRP